MTRITLYTGGGISMSPTYEDGRRVSSFVRLVADEGRGITDGTIITNGIDTKNPEMWSDCELPPEEETSSHTAEELESKTSAELQEILSGMGISANMNKTNMIQLILSAQEME